jgi:antitoxin component YwqK of YwqJK toxin-antitoxin module
VSEGHDAQKIFFRCMVLVPLMILLVPVTIGAQTVPADGWYESNGSGIALGPVDGPSGARWTLLVASDEHATRMTLHQDGVPTRTTLREYGSTGTVERETVEEGVELREESIFDAGGKPSLERRFLPDGVIEETVYEYVDDRLMSKTTRRGDTQIGTVSYVYASDGRLLSARESAGPFYGSGKTANGGSSTWRKGPDGLELRSYDSTGRLVSIRAYDGAILRSSESRTWVDGMLESSIVRLPGGSTTTTMFANSGSAAGKVLSITIERAGKIVSAERMTYEAKGALSRIETVVNGKVSSREYEYDEEGALVVEKRNLDAEQSIVVLYETTTTRIEEAYLKGTLFARVRYEDGRRVKEEIFRDGIIVRSRTFE